MFDYITELNEGPVVAFRVSDRVTEEDFAALSDEMDERIDEHGSVRLYVEFDGIPLPELEALDDDLKLWRRYSNDISRYAIVGEGRLLKWGTAVSDRLTGVEVEFFNRDDREAAHEWIDEGITA
ncbi:STAS/SEC14 domain-containing protein [Halobaculum marinum]|uniref:STAS/SEC14 domain-containing protein n=1 Tax=Halobaculum marinum TaxID=3031996 RepID=A0ABD5WQF9_9EURY|nr:STAS/SEC14 domain-containing protein [Halobaculum sp. DT55]